MAAQTDDAATRALRAIDSVAMARCANVRGDKALPAEVSATLCERYESERVDGRGVWLLRAAMSRRLRVRRNVEPVCHDVTRVVQIQREQARRDEAEKQANEMRNRQLMEMLQQQQQQQQLQQQYLQQQQQHLQQQQQQPQQQSL